MLYTREWVASNYNKYNKEIWGGALPNFNTLDFALTNAKRPWGQAGCKRWVRDNNNTPCAKGPVLRLSNYYDSPEDVKLNVLLHEMCHLYECFCEPKYIIKTVLKKRFTNEYPRDGHGKVFFEQAARVKSLCGIEITRFVKDSEIEASNTNSEKMASYAKKIESMGGVPVYIFKLIDTSKCEFAFAKVENANAQAKWNEFLSSDRYKRYFTDILYCKSFSPKCVEMTSSRSVSWYLIKEINNFFAKYSLNVEKVLMGDINNFRLTGGSSSEQNAGNGEKRYKSFTMKFTNGQTLTYNNVTMSDVAARLSKSFPKWNEEIINKFAKNENLYTESMKRVKKDKLDYLVERALRDALDNLTEDDNLNVSDEDMEMLNNNFLTTLQ